MDKKLIKSKYGVYLYEAGENIEMYIEEQLVLSISNEFKNVMLKSYDNLIKLRKEDWENEHK